MIPNRENCLRILKEKNPENIVNHCLQVTNVAMQIGRAYKEAGFDIDLKLLEAGALLHDVCKWDELQTKSKIHHAYLAEEFLKKDFPELCNLVKRHTVKEFKHLDFHDWTLEEKIVHYSDNRVTHDKIVSMDYRYIDIKKRYPERVTEFNNTENISKALEKDLFSKIKLNPEDIK